MNVTPNEHGRQIVGYWRLPSRPFCPHYWAGSGENDAQGTGGRGLRPFHQGLSRGLLILQVAPAIPCSWTAIVSFSPLFKWGWALPALFFVQMWLCHRAHSTLRQIFRPMGCLWRQIKSRSGSKCSKFKNLNKKSLFCPFSPCFSTFYSFESLIRLISFPCFSHFLSIFRILVICGISRNMCWKENSKQTGVWRICLCQGKCLLL